MAAVELPFDGERFIPGMAGATELEHVHRYALALRLAAGKVVLDIASGEGYGSHMLSHVAAKVIGVDVSEQAVEHARQTYRAGNLEYRVGSCAAIPLDDASVDLVVSFETIEHHDQHEEMMREISRVLKPDGLLVISSPNKHEYSDVPGFHNPFHVKELYLDEFRSLLGRYFGRVAILGQRVLQASLIAAMDAAPCGLEHGFADDSSEPTHGVARPLYFIALASNASLPTVPNGLLEAGAAESADVRSLSVNPVRFQVYWRSGEELFSESSSAAFQYPVGAAAAVYRLTMELPATGVAALRVDVADRPMACTLLGLSLRDSAGETVWNWDGAVDRFVSTYDSFFVLLPPPPTGSGKAAGVQIICTGSDPRFELQFNEAETTRLAGRVLLQVEVSARYLLPGYSIDLRSIAADLAATRGELASQRESALAALADMSAVARQAQEDLQRERKVMEKLRNHRWWSALNRLFRLEQA